MLTLHLCIYTDRRTNRDFYLYGINILVLCNRGGHCLLRTLTESVLYSINQTRFAFEGLTMKLVRAVVGLCSCELRSFRLRNNKITFGNAPNVYLREWKRLETKVAEEYCWAITGVGAVMRRPIIFQCIGVWISAGLPCIFACGWARESWAPACGKI